MTEVKRNVVVVLGTRPEAIKLAPVIKALETSESLTPITVATAQHRGLMDQPLDFFSIRPDYDLNLMKPNQDLFYTTTRCLSGLKNIFEQVQPDMLVVQGDTTTAFASSLAGFYCKVPVAHVEAGLRTQDKYSPFPEEINRHLIAPLSDLHFAPTEKAKNNLLAEGIPEANVLVTGNTSIDALLMGMEKKLSPPEELRDRSEETPLILVTMHRRENFGSPLQDIFSAIKSFAVKHPEFHIVFPVHPNPSVKEAAEKWLSQIANLSLISPVGYAEMLYLMKRARFILTDSGGVQEEAPSLGKPVLVLRESTERPEAVECGCALLVGHHTDLILQLMESLTDSHSEIYQNMSQARNPFGDGNASQRIVQQMERFFKEQDSRQVL